MKVSNITLGKDVRVDPSSNINNIKIGDNTKIAANVTVFGAEQHQLEIGSNCYIGPKCLIEGFNAKVIIGDHVSFAQNINLMSGSGPNASEKMQRVFPVKKGGVTIGDHTWIGASAIIMPNLSIGRFCIVAANSFVNQSFDDYSIVGGSPARLIRFLTEEEINTVSE
jgi:acetyltransferase-like isoleucine patch superfamily enzyme